MRRLAGALCLLLAWGCGTTGARPAGEVRLAGSDTMLPLARRLAERFMAAHPQVAVRVEGGSSGAGIAAMIDGRVDLCTASRPLSPDEVQILAERRGTLGVTYLVAQDALSVYLHPSNPVRDLSLEQLRAVFTGEVRDWREVGGHEGAVVALIRPPASGTHRFFRDHVLLGADYRADARVLATTTEIVAAVAADPHAVGYGGAVFGPDLVHCAVDGVPPPTRFSAGPSDYPLTRFLTLVAAAPPDGWARRFVDWCQGPQGQKVVPEVGYLPLWPPTSRGMPRPVEACLPVPVPVPVPDVNHGASARERATPGGAQLEWSYGEEGTNTAPSGTGTGTGTGTSGERARPPPNLTHR